MTVEELKKRLYRVKEMDDAINRKLERLSEMKIQATCTGTINYDKRVQTSPKGDRLENAIAGYVDLNNEINMEIDAFVDYRKNVISEIRKLKKIDERRVLLMKYIKYYSVSEIAFRICVSDRTTKRIHKAALLHLAEELSTS